MSEALPVDALALRKEIKSKYRAVAVDPRDSYHLHTGRPLARHHRQQPNGDVVRHSIFALAAVCLLLFGGSSSITYAADAQKPLFERLGGLKGITVVVDDFVDRLVANKTLNKNLAINQGRINSPAPYLKFQVSQLVCQVTGGPCKYTGIDLKQAHAHLNITEKEWEVMATEFQKSLDKYKVPAAEQKELFQVVAATKGDIVTKP